MRRRAENRGEKALVKGESTDKRAGGARSLTYAGDRGARLPSGFCELGPWLKTVMQSRTLPLGHWG